MKPQRLLTFMFGAAYELGRYAHNHTMDTLFGKPEPFEFQGSTQPLDKHTARGHTHR